MSESSDEHVDPADALLQRGAYLRRLKAMAEEAEHVKEEQNDESNRLEWDETISKDGSRTLLYESFLSNQYSYDDLKHVDYKYIQYGETLIVEQEKSLGKGGIVWDAAHILSEYLCSRRQDWLSDSDLESVQILELGCGTGLAGMLLAQNLAQLQTDKTHHCEIFLTDLPNLMPLLDRNLNRNFHRDTLDRYRVSNTIHLTGKVLDWASIDKDATLGNVIIGADVVASLYDPVALARTIHTLCKNRETRVYVSFKERLSSIHRCFEAEMQVLFEEVTFHLPESARNRNPQVKILSARRPIDKL